MTEAAKRAFAEKLEEQLRVKLIKIAHQDHCVLIEKAATLALNQFRQRYTDEMISYDPLLQAEVARLTAAKTIAWDDLFAAERAACPPTLESLLWKVAKSGYTKEVARFMNLSKATRGCKNLQRYMRKVRNWGEYGSGGMTQLHFYCRKGITSSVMRFLNMRSIDLDANLSHEAQGWACLISAVYNGHLDICRLLIDKGAQIEEKTRFDMTPLHFAAAQGRIEIV
jgi:hypothetical protein